MSEICYPAGLEPLAHGGLEWQAARLGATCRFVCGMSERLIEEFCGRKREPNAPYCEGHMAWVRDTAKPY